MIFKILILVLFNVHLSLSNGCPSDEDLYPCYCDWSGLEGRKYSYTTVYCENLNNNEALIKAAKALIGATDVTSINIINSVFNFIPSSVFKGTKLPEIYIEKTSLMGLTDTDVAFVGLEDSLERLIMKRCTLMNEWNWEIIRNLKKLHKIAIEEGDLENIEDLGKISLNLWEIDFFNNRISFIHPQAFSNFKSLMTLKLAQNEISEMQRSMIPNPAAELTLIDLGYNKIKQFPEDMFTNMPKLKQIIVPYNQILHLKEDIFKGPWSNLIVFDARGNELSCDCRMSWILEIENPKAVWAECAQPQELKGKNLASIQPKHLLCFH